MTMDPLSPVSSQISKHGPFTEEIVTRWLVAGLGLITASTVTKEELFTVISLGRTRAGNEANLKPENPRRPSYKIKLNE